jgi:vacuolar-type H+-ATPase subunit I/STV1
MGALKAAFAYVVAMVSIFGAFGLLIMAFQISSLLSLVVAGVAIAIGYGGISLLQHLDK